jgi:biopolymer transport protein ExbD/biopolymer transport protein TolR
LYVNAKPVQEAELATKVSELLENKPGGERIVIIRADEEVEYGAVMSAMDALRTAGIEDIGLITEPTPQGTGAPAPGGK